MKYVVLFLLLVFCINCGSVSFKERGTQCHRHEMCIDPTKRSNKRVCYHGYCVTPCGWGPKCEENEYCKDVDWGPYPVGICVSNDE